MRNWQEHRFGDLVHFPPRVVLRKGDHYPFIEMDVVNPNNRYVESPQRKKYESSSCSKFANGDVLLARITPCLENGKIAQVRIADDQGGFGSTEFFVFRAKDELQDQGFLFYLTKCDLIWKSAVNSMVGASGRQRADATFLKKLRVTIPKPPIQRKIAAILSAYDDLIENNKQRIALLEKMAEGIYREWFVRFRFPGHEKVKVVKGVPERWEVLPFSEIVKINPSERIDKSEEVPFVGMEDLSLSSMFFIPKEIRKGGSGSKFRNRDVLFPRITPSVENGKRGFVMTLADGQVGLGSTEFIVMREKVIGAEHIYFLTCSSDFRKHAELSMAGASGRQRVHENCFSFFLVKTPPPEVRQQFSEFMKPHFSQIHLLSRQTDRLVKSRDMLLPRLISGKLSVENLNIQFPPSMEEELNTEPTAVAHG
jgi:type I restriction enzyme, S subunit